MPSVAKIVNQRKTFATTFRGDIRTLATLALYFRTKDEVPRSMIEVIGLAVESLKYMVVQACPDTEVTEYHQAVQILEKLGILDMSKEFRNKQSLLKALSLEDLDLGGGDPTYGIRKKIKSGKSGPFESEQEKKRTLEILEEVTAPDCTFDAESIQASLDRRAKEDEEAKQQLGVPPKEE